MLRLVCTAPLPAPLSFTTKQPEGDQQCYD